MAGDARIARQVRARRIVWAIIAAAVLFPLLVEIPVPEGEISKDVRAVYERIEAIPAGGALFLSFDFDPGSKPELAPMALALARHAFSRDLRVVGMALWVTGTSMAEKILFQAAQEHEQELGRDYSFLGWAPGGFLVITGVGQDLKNQFPQDFYKQDTRGLRVLDGLDSLRNFDLVVSLAAGNPGLEEWVVYGGDKYGFPLAGGCTGVMAAGLYPFLQTGQIKGLLGGIKGAAEYEALLAREKGMEKGMGSAGDLSVSFAHFALILLILAGNFIHWRERRKVGAS